MPYIQEQARAELNAGRDAHSAGELNYQVSRLVDGYITRQGLGYKAINEAMGVLACAQAELYRRVAAPYEDGKAREHGEVYLNV